MSGKRALYTKKTPRYATTLRFDKRTCYVVSRKNNVSFYDMERAKKSVLWHQELFGGREKKSKTVLNPHGDHYVMSAILVYYGDGR